MCKNHKFFDNDSYEDNSFNSYNFLNLSKPFSADNEDFNYSDYESHLYKKNRCEKY